jgi:hypothetical protein
MGTSICCYYIRYGVDAEVYIRNKRLPRGSPLVIEHHSSLVEQRAVHGHLFDIDSSLPGATQGPIVKELTASLEWFKDHKYGYGNHKQL